VGITLGVMIFRPTQETSANGRRLAITRSVMPAMKKGKPRGLPVLFNFQALF
jgi:hypothetical protein